MKCLKTLIPIVFLMYLVLDYFGLPSLFGIKISNINIDILNIFITTSIAIVLYVISYHYIDKRQLDKDANAKGIVQILFKKTYEECLSNIEMLDDKKHMEAYIVPKVNFDKVASDNKVVQNFQNNPFSSFDTIMEFSQNGYITMQELDTYLDIRSKYQLLVNLKITFYDLKKGDSSVHKVLQNEIDTIQKNLVGKIKATINQES